VSVLLAPMLFILCFRPGRTAKAKAGILRPVYF